MSTATSLTVQWDSYTTFACSSLSVLGSVIVLCSYMVATSTATPRAAQLIRNLAIADFFWFSAGLTESVYWVFTDSTVPAGLCYVFSPVVNFMRMASLIWTCAISFDVLMSVNKRKWLWVGDIDSNNWTYYRRIYYLTVLVFALPNCILNIIKQHSADGNQDLGCNPGYEKIGDAWMVFFSELLPISLGFFCNVYVYIQVRERMSQKAFPQSVRKRRRRIMYHYIIVCIICWTPTMIFYLSEISGLHSSALEIVARSSLYLTGFFNFLVFGMQDPHLKRSFSVIMKSLGCCCCLVFVGDRLDAASGLKTKEVDKTVMFGGHIEDNADVSKDKKNIYRYHKLTNEDKQVLYHDRPDLDPKADISIPKKSNRVKSRSIDFTKVNGVRDFGDDDDREREHNISEPLLSDEEKRQIFADDLYGDSYTSQGSSSSNSSGHSRENLAAAVQSPMINTHGSAGYSIYDDDREDVAGPVITSIAGRKISQESNSTELEVLRSSSSVDSPLVRDQGVGVGDTEAPRSPSATHVKLSEADMQSKGRILSSEERISAARSRMKQLRQGGSPSPNGPLISDQESLANALTDISHTRGSGSGSSNGSLSSFSNGKGQGQDSPDSSGDEADEEDHALAELLVENIDHAPSASSSLSVSASYLVAGSS